MEISSEMAVLLSGLAVSFVVAITTEIIKVKWFADLNDTYKKLFTRVICLAGACVVALIQIGWQYLPAQYATTIITMFSLATVWYKLAIENFETK